MDTLNYIANANGSILCELFDSNGLEQNLTGCYITFNLGYEYENQAIISKNMDILGTNKCSVQLMPEDTEMLGIGEYEFNLIIIDGSNNKHVTSKVKLSIDRPIE